MATPAGIRKSFPFNSLDKKAPTKPVNRFQGVTCGGSNTFGPHSAHDCISVETKLHRLDELAWQIDPFDGFDFYQLIEFADDLTGNFDWTGFISEGNENPRPFTKEDAN